jgi:hypothetical protein
MTTGASAIWLLNNRTAAHQRHRHADRRVTKTDVPTRA